MQSHERHQIMCVGLGLLPCPLQMRIFFFSIFLESCNNIVHCRNRNKQIPSSLSLKSIVFLTLVGFFLGICLQSGSPLCSFGPQRLLFFFHLLISTKFPL